MSEKHCPTCRAVMDYMDHGFCSDCKKYCGCSFSPTSMSDYCHAHRPGGKPRPVFEELFCCDALDCEKIE